VIGYAYDDRWGKMTVKGFFKRRLIRLHPMVVIGVALGCGGVCGQHHCGVAVHEILRCAGAPLAHPENGLKIANESLKNISYPMF